MANNTKSTNASVAATAASTTEVKEVAAEASKAYDMAYVVTLFKQIKDINTSLKDNEAYEDIDRISTSVTFGKVSAKKATKTDAAVLGNFGYAITAKSKSFGKGLAKEWFLTAYVNGISLDGVSVMITEAKDGKCKLSKIESSRKYEETSTSLRNGVASDVFTYMKAKGLTSKDYKALVRDYVTRLEARITWTKEEIAKAMNKEAAAESTAVSA